jgi:type II restriction/modification system DNA methylase subunit YeeA
MIGALGGEYVEKLRDRYDDDVSRFADLVCFWFEKAREQIEITDLERAGLVATNSIRGGKNRLALDRIASHCKIYDAWADEPWILDGAAVRVSLVCFGASHVTDQLRLDGRNVKQINTDLTSSDADVARANQLKENAGIAFNGIQKTGPFEIPGEQARQWLKAPINPNGLPNSSVLKPYFNGIDITRRPRDSWIIDFGPDSSEIEAAGFEGPFEYAKKVVRPERAKNTIEALRAYWWRFWRPRPEMHDAVGGLTRFIVSPEVSKHRIFVWLPPQIGADKNLIAIAKADATTFGILHSRFHELWALRLGTSLEDRPRYTPSTTFETFPFPEGLTPSVAAKEYANDSRAKRIETVAAKLDESRENWLNPADLVKHEPEVVSGYPDRILPKTLAAEEQLKKRTLTNLYNERPTWLALAHRDLDRAVAVAYGWPEKLADRAQPGNPDTADRKAAEEEILKRLFDLNQARAKAGR